MTNKEIDSHYNYNQYRTQSIHAVSDYLLSKGDGKLPYPMVFILESTMSEEPDKDLLEQGWEPRGYDHYDALYRYRKAVDIREVITGIRIVFDKKTDDRDRNRFGFTSAELKAMYTYPVPEDMREELSRSVHRELHMKHDNHYIPGYYIGTDVRDGFFKRVRDRLLEDEYTALLDLYRSHRNAMVRATNASLSKSEQILAWKNSTRELLKASPVYCDQIHDSNRADLILKRNNEYVENLRKQQNQ